MTKIAPSTAVNRYYLARMEAAERNERMSSREGASEETGIDRKRLQRIEIGTLQPVPRGSPADGRQLPRAGAAELSLLAVLHHRTAHRSESGGERTGSHHGEMSQRA